MKIKMKVTKVEHIRSGSEVQLTGFFPFRDGGPNSQLSLTYLVLGSGDGIPPEKRPTLVPGQEIELDVEGLDA
jgi:hypothetical protein